MYLCCQKYLTVSQTQLLSPSQKLFVQNASDALKQVNCSDVHYVLEMSVAVVPSSAMAKSSVQIDACFVLAWMMSFSTLGLANLSKRI